MSAAGSQVFVEFIAGLQIWSFHVTVSLGTSNVKRKKIDIWGLEHAQKSFFFLSSSMQIPGHSCCWRGRHCVTSLKMHESQKLTYHHRSIHS